jgi:hypothetical protein
MNTYNIERYNTSFIDKPGKNGTVRIIMNTPGKIRLHITSDSLQPFVWKESSYPGWQLYVNKARQKLTSGERLFLEWEVPTGESDNILIYSPASFYFGIILTILSLALFAYYGIKKICAA